MGSRGSAPNHRQAVLDAATQPPAPLVVSWLQISIGTSILQPFLGLSSGNRPPSEAGATVAGRTI